MTSAISEERSGSEFVGKPVPPHIAEELATIRNALLDAGTSAERWGQLYVAQQALTWAFNEDLAAAPYAVIVDGKVQRPNSGIQVS